MFSCRQSSDKVLVLGAPAIKAEKTATEAYDDVVAASAEEQARMAGGNF
jgi:hypothetical protein